MDEYLPLPLWSIISGSTRGIVKFPKVHHHIPVEKRPSLCRRLTPDLSITSELFIESPTPLWCCSSASLTCSRACFCRLCLIFISLMIPPIWALKVLLGLDRSFPSHPFISGQKILFIYYIAHLALESCVSFFCAADKSGSPSCTCLCLVLPDKKRKSNTLTSVEFGLIYMCSWISWTISVGTE